MSIITLDFETYYTKGLGFKTQTTEEYVRDRRFEVIGVGVKIDDAPATWFSGTKVEIHNYLSTLPWDTNALLCHNTLFDGCILSWHFGVNPMFMLDTLCMARALHGVDVGGSLASLSARYGIGKKGDEVLKAEGKRREDFTKEELATYGDYCINDVELTYKLWLGLSSAFPDDELGLIDMTLRMFTHPVFMVDDALLQDRAIELKEEKLALLEGLMGVLKCNDAESVRKKLASNKQFAEVLTLLEIPVPMKTSKTTGKETYALAKNDEEFLKLLEHEDPTVQQLCAVRLGTKSTIEESRIERFIDVGKRNKGRLPIPLKYYGAHTGRWAGSDKVNFQNLPSRDKKKKALKNAVIPPDGHVVINCDSSQIEARVLAWLAGQDDVVKQFADGEDVYSVFASKIYKRPISKADPIERFVGKTCILGLGYGTGKLKLQHTLKTTPPGITVSEADADNYVEIYRETNDKVIQLWKDGDKALKHLASWPDKMVKGQFVKGTPQPPYYYGKTKCVIVRPDGIQLPNGLYLRYPDLKWDTEGSKSGHVYTSRKGKVSIWGGTLVENVVQALARIVVGEQMLKINQRYRVALTVHDAAVCVVPEEELSSALAYIVECMSVPPDWARGLPVACEASHANSYGEC
jgi:DNA polymerase